MTTRRLTRPVLLVGAALVAVAALAAPRALAQKTPAAPPAASSGPAREAILLTIFLRHDQSRTLPEINAQLEKSGFHEKFPPPGIEVVSWYVMMGIGQVVTLRVPPERLREVNLAIENGAWGAYRTDFYPTYDYRPIWEAQRKRK